MIMQINKPIITLRCSNCKTKECNQKVFLEKVREIINGDYGIETIKFKLREIPCENYEEII